jgi:hypothetical protein
MKCRSCSVEIREIAKFCPVCGVNQKPENDVNSEVVFPSMNLDLLVRPDIIYVPANIKKYRNPIILFFMSVFGIMGFFLGLTSLVFFGLVAGWISYKFIGIRMVSSASAGVPKKLANCKIIAHGMASVSEGMAANGGWIYLLPDGIFFQPIGKNISSEPLHLLFVDVKEIVAAGGFDPLSVKIKIVGKYNNNIFVSVFNRNKWLELMNEVRSYGLVKQVVDFGDAGNESADLIKRAKNKGEGKLFSISRKWLILLGVSVLLIVGILIKLFSEGASNSSSSPVEKDKNIGKVSLNILETAVNPYSGNKQKWDEFVDNGGLNKENNFHGISVRGATVEWHGDTKGLKAILFNVSKSVAPADIRRALNQACRTDESSWIKESGALTTGEVINGKVKCRYLTNETASSYDVSIDVEK